MKRTKIALTAAAVAVALGAGLGLSYQASAQEPTPTPTARVTPAPGSTQEAGSATRAPRHRRRHAVRAAYDEALASELGMSVEAFQTARKTAHDRVELQEDEGTTPNRRESPEGHRAAHDEALATELGITVAQLQAARDRAEAKVVSEAVASGRLTQQQADAISARRTLRATIDERALVAGVLGMSREELEQAHQDGQRLSDLLSARGMTRESFRAALTEALNAEIERAVAAGTITQAQADALRAEGLRGPGLGRHGARGVHRGPRGAQPPAAGTPTPDSGR